ncbi:hypothetical protein [Achromobacter xylosoxidans]|uniref:hypothetical protein n=1 Tax=Alcaligenes xylosoxydans xylosoxydans TaxID=85698 RepID=UPI0006C5A81F|nr:hypothetical protein [Achromobacter xylosoxidans]CUI98315.1 Uncharacterised protein [Achromobacter xylosoxidans]
MEETERAASTANLMQGDILELIGQGFDFNLATIINADCDMQNSKHDGMVAILPIYTFHRYLEKFWLPGFFLRQRNEAVSLLRTVVELPDRHVEDLVEWIKSDSNPRINIKAESIFSGKSLDGKKMEKANTAIHKLVDVMDAEIRGTLSSVGLFAPKEEEKAKKYYRDQVVEAKKQMGDGNFFVTDIKGHAEIGYVVRMRRIYTLPIEACFTSNSECQALNRDGLAAFRISKFTANYKFKVSQLFAHQYSRIGLPDEITALSELAVMDAVQKLQGEFHG